MISVYQVQAYITQQLPDLIPQITIEGFTMNQHRAGTIFDFAAQVQVKGVKKTLLGGIQPRGDRYLVQQAIQNFRQTGLHQDDVYFVLTAPYLDEQGLDICRRHQVGGLDLAGNILLEFDNVYIHRVVPSSSTNVVQPGPTMQFPPITARIIRTMLTKPERTWKLRELGRMAKASAAQVYKVSNKLVSENLGKKTQAGLSLTNPGILLDTWTATYDFFRDNAMLALRNPTSLANFYQTLRYQPEETYAFTLHSALALLAGETAAAPTYLYASNTLAQHLQQQGWQPAAEGKANDLYLIQGWDVGGFGDRQKALTGEMVLGNVQLYLDLFTSGQVKAAQQVRAEKLGF